MKKYRYILCGLVGSSDPVNNFRLISGNTLGDTGDAIRIEIPEDMHLEKLSCDSYSTTSDTRLIKDLHPTCRVLINNRWVDMTAELKDIQPHAWGEYMLNHGYFWNIVSGRGYMLKSDLNKLDI